MLSTKSKAQPALERAVAKYEMKLAKAPNPTQRQYASKMLHMARAALAESQAGEPVREAETEGVVTLHADEYEVC